MFPHRTFSGWYAGKLQDPDHVVRGVPSCLVGALCPTPPVASFAKIGNSARAVWHGACFTNAQMSEQAQAKLVLVEPGVAADAAMADTAEHNLVLLLGQDESAAGFRERVRRRTEALRSRAERLRDVAYVVSEHTIRDWEARLSLLAEVCNTVAPDGQLELFAPSTARREALGCLGDLQASVPPGLRLRAVFTEAQTA